MERGARLFAALLLALAIGWALGELPGHDTVLWLVPVCVFIAIATGPALTGGWLMLAGLATSPVYAWSFIVAYDHHPNTSETNDALAGIIIWSINAAAVIAVAMVLGVVRTIRSDSPG